jgi:hypothetical protein
MESENNVMRALAPKDIVKAKYHEADVFLNLSGRDRPGVIATVTSLLERQQLYVADILFSTGVKRKSRYKMQVLARGPAYGVKEIGRLVETGEMLKLLDNVKGDHIHYSDSFIFHLDLHTPDRRGLTATVASFVGMPRQTLDRTEHGSFLTLHGITYNSDGPEGGVGYFSLQATIATRCREVRDEIVSDLRKWAEETIELDGGRMTIQ